VRHRVESRTAIDKRFDVARLERNGAIEACERLFIAIERM
jgi:hypothetical protein